MNKKKLPRVLTEAQEWSFGSYRRIAGPGRPLGRRLDKPDPKYPAGELTDRMRVEWLKSGRKHGWSKLSGDTQSDEVGVNIKL
jgi:hypothetical protein